MMEHEKQSSQQQTSWWFQNGCKGEAIRRGWGEHGPQNDSRYDLISKLRHYCLRSCSSARVTVLGRVHKQLLWEKELFRELAIQTRSDQSSCTEDALLRFPPSFSQGKFRTTDELEHTLFDHLFKLSLLGKCSFFLNINDFLNPFVSLVQQNPTPRYVT